MMSLVPTGWVARVRRIVRVGVVLAAGWWLFADTWRRHIPVPEDGRTLRFAHFGGHEDYEFWRKTVQAFEARSGAEGGSRVRVRQEFVVGLGDHYHTKLRQQLIAGSAPDVALIQLGPFEELGSHFADLGSLTVAEPSDEPLTRFLDPGGVGAFRREGAQLALPIAGGNLAIYVNRRCWDRLRERGMAVAPVPNADWDMEEFHALAKALTVDLDGDGSMEQFGFWLPRWIYYLPFTWSFGAEVVRDEGGTWALRGGAAESALSFYRRLAVEDRVCPGPNDLPQMFQDTAFLTGRVAMCVNGPWFQPFLDATNLADSYEILPIPRGPGGRWTRMTWDGVVVARGQSAARRALSERFVRFLLSEEIQSRMARSGRALPARRSAVAAFLEGGRVDRRGVFVELLPHSRLQPRSTSFAAVDRAVNRTFARAADAREAAPVGALLERLEGDPAIVAAFGHSGGDVP